VAVPAANSEKAKAEKDAVVKRTIEFQTKRAEEGSTTAQFDLAKRYMTGDGLEKNLAEARRWFEAAAKQGHPGAAARLEEVKKLEANSGRNAAPKATPAK
jgi:TPR repeat protein